MPTPRNLIDKAIKGTVVPRLRAMGFQGSFPHFRRIGSDQVDLLTFQFDLHGGGFVIEIAICPPEGVTHSWGEKVPPNKVRAWDVMERLRLQPKLGSSRFDWFRYDQYMLETDSEKFEAVARQVLRFLEIAERWWRGEDHKYLRDYEFHFREGR